MKIEKIASDGKGIVRTENGVVFVSNALPGETVEAEIILRKREYAVARATKILEPNAHRVPVPPCPHFGECGGCQLQHADYPLQLEIKASFVEDAIRRIGKFDTSEMPAKITCIPSPQIWNYRNKASFPVKKIDGKASIGFYAVGSHRLVKIESCKIIDEKLNFAYRKIREKISDLGIEPYDEARHKGMLRHIMLRTNGEKILVSFVMNGKLSSLQREKILEFSHVFQNSTFTVNFNNQKGNTIMGSKTEILTGDGHIETRVGGHVARYDTTSFFQVNSPQAEQIYSHAAALIEHGSSVLELYSGVGSMTMRLADKAGHVVAVEEWHPAVELMKRNVEANGFENIVPICAKSEDFLVGEVDSVVLDPPRGGCDEAVLLRIAERKVPQVVYVSCNPATLARDMARLRGHGYKIASLQAFDMFPQTTHVECVAELRR